MTREALHERLRAMDGDQRRLAVLVLILIVVATLFAGRSLFGSGSTHSSSAPTLPRRAASAAVRERVADVRQSNAAKAATKAAARAKVAKAAAATTTTIAQLSSDESFQVFETRDPFQPPVSPTPTVPPATTPGTTPGTTPPVVTPETTATTQAPSFVPPTGQTVAVVDIFTASDGSPRAHVRVGSTVYNVGVGDTFAVSYKVVSLKKPCGEFLFGDSSFQLCEGEETIK